MSPKKRVFSAADKIAFIGAGRMAEAVIAGLLKSKTLAPKQVIVSDVNSERTSRLAGIFKVSRAGDNAQAALKADITVLAVKPQNIPDVLKEIDLRSSRLVISIAAGVRIAAIEKAAPGVPVVRVMPNNPALIRKGISAIAAGSSVKEEDMQAAAAIFRSVGDVIEIKESLMDAVTGLSGSGPAFVYLFAEAMAEAGAELGMTKGVAEKLAYHTILGSAETLLKSGKDPRELREMVTSPGGTTRAGLNVLESKGFKQALIDAITAAARRASELSS